jgi:hypothetical protein
VRRATGRRLHRAGEDGQAARLSRRELLGSTARWDRLGIAVDFTVLKHRLAELKARFAAGAYYHVGDTDLDAAYATDAGFRFLRADAAAHRAWVSELFASAPE